MVADAIIASATILRRWNGACTSLTAMATTPSSEPLSQRLAAIREQMTLLSDYL